MLCVRVCVVIVGGEILNQRVMVLLVSGILHMLNVLVCAIIFVASHPIIRGHLSLFQTSNDKHNDIVF